MDVIQPSFIYFTPSSRIGPWNITRTAWPSCSHRARLQQTADPLSVRSQRISAMAPSSPRKCRSPCICWHAAKTAADKRQWRRRSTTSCGNMAKARSESEWTGPIAAGRDHVIVASPPHPSASRMTPAGLPRIGVMKWNRSPGWNGIFPPCTGILFPYITVWTPSR